MKRKRSGTGKWEDEIKDEDERVEDEEEQNERRTRKKEKPKKRQGQGRAREMRKKDKSRCKIRKTNLPILSQTSTSYQCSYYHFLLKTNAFGRLSRSFNAKSQVLKEFPLFFSQVFQFLQEKRQQKKGYSPILLLSISEMSSKLERFLISVSSVQGNAHTGKHAAVHENL